MEDETLLQSMQLFTLLTLTVLRHVAGLEDLESTILLSSWGNYQDGNVGHPICNNKLIDQQYYHAKV